MTEKDIEPGQTWTIDRMRPEDAWGVARLFRDIYGDDYPIRTFIDPEVLIAENKAGRTISSVARTPKGDIVGHNAIFKSAPSEKIFESGAGLVHRSYRGGRGIFKDLILHGFGIASNQLCPAIWGEPICNQVFSQQACESVGLKPFAVEVGLMPPSVYSIEGGATGRVTALMTFKELNPRTNTILAPKIYVEQLGLLNSKMSIPRTISISSAQPSKGVATTLKTQVFPFAQVARLTVMEIGQDMDSVFNNIERDVLGQGVQVLQAWLCLSDAAVGWAVDRLREKGYFFGGLLPYWFDDDGLLMQRLVQHPNWEDIQLAFDWSRTLVGLVHSDWKNLYG